MQTFNIIDWAIIAIVGFSILVGIIRGATREVLGIMGWLGATLTVVYGLPLLRSLGRHYINNTLLADSLVAGLLFIMSLSLFIFISRSLSQRIKSSALGGLDRSFGLIFGAFRGLLIIFLAFLSLSFFFKAENIPESIKIARLTPWMTQGANQLRNIIPNEYFPHELQSPSDFVPPNILNHTLPSIEETVKQLSTLKPSSQQKKSESPSSSAVNTSEKQDAKTP